MALFTDGIMSALEDLTAQDSSILEICSAEGIDLTRKLELAQDEVGIELAAALKRQGSQDMASAGPGVGNVVVTPALKLWHTFRSLELAYRDAFHNQLNDRYRGRRDEYRDLARWAAEKLLQTGIGLSASPVPKAGPMTLQAAAGTMPAGTYYFAMSWVGGSAEEGAGSEVQSFELAIAGGVAVEPGDVPAGVSGWNVFAGATEDTVRLQNGSLLETERQWLQSSLPSNGGRRPGSGPEATWFSQVPRVIQRG